MSREQQTASAEVITQHHQYFGLITSGGQRLADVLSDPARDLVELEHTLVRTAGRPTEIRCRHLLLLKREVLMVIPKGGHEAPIRRHNNFQAKHPYGVILVLPAYVLCGVAHLPQRANPWMLVDESSGLPSFFGLTDVTMRSSPHSVVDIHHETVIVHRQRIESLELSDRPLPKLGPSEKVGAAGSA